MTDNIHQPEDMNTLCRKNADTNSGTYSIFAYLSCLGKALQNKKEHPKSGWQCVASGLTDGETSCFMRYYEKGVATDITTSVHVKGATSNAVCYELRLGNPGKPTSFSSYKTIR